jgi:hypothetical protein
VNTGNGSVTVSYDPSNPGCVVAVVARPEFTG